MKYFKLFFKKTLRYLLKPLSFVPALILMFLIYDLSAMDGETSSAVSYKVTMKIVNVAEEVFDKNWDNAHKAVLAERIHRGVRKTAHVTEYFLLGAAVALPLYVYKVRGVWLLIIATLFCLAFAGLDEYHQSFVVGRSPGIRDVAIDAMGIVPGVILTHIISFICRKTIFAPLSL